METIKTEKSRFKKIILTIINIAVLISSILLVFALSYDILETGKYDPTSPITLKIQFWVCIVFLTDLFVRMWLAENHWRYLFRNILQLIISIPFLSIITNLDVTVNQELHYALSLMPIIRSGYGLVMLVRWFSNHRATSLLVSYLTVLTVLLYFSSLLFFIVEKGINSQVNTYWDALWWAGMDMTTVGSNIIAVTPIGKILSFIVAAAGVMMLPIFTVFITDKIQTIRKRDQEASNKLKQEKLNAKHKNTENQITITTTTEISNENNA